MIKIALIDTGCTPLVFNKNKIKGFFEIKNEKLTRSEKVYDTNGHGTACSYIIDKMCDEYELYIYKIFNDSLVTKTKYLNIALEHCISQNYNFINLSLGIISQNNLEKLQEICHKLVKNNCNLICSCSDDGTKCWPAEFPFVIRVFGENFSKKDVFRKINTCNSLYAYSGEQKVIGLNGKYNIVYGTSFACARVTGFLAQQLKENPMKNIKDIIKTLPANTFEPQVKTKAKSVNQLNWIKNALVFPFNKEMHSIIRFESQLPFNIKHVVDLPLLGNVGKTTDELLVYCNHSHIIHGNFKKALDDEIDTVILGDLSELSKIYKKNQTEKYSQIAFEAGKNVVSIEFLDKQIYKSIKNSSKKFNCHFICLNDVLSSDENWVAPNVEFSPPILSVLGTGPQVGKFTFQMQLRILLKNLGYKISTISTEPQAFLFELNTIPLGNYNLIDKINFHRQINYIKNMIYTINQTENPELIIIGGQSGVVPFSKAINIDFSSLSSIITILAAKPDGCVLCINFEDSLEYIQRTIAAIESFGYGKVFMCVISSMSKQITRHGALVYENKTHYSQNELINKIESLERFLNIPVINILSEEGQINCIINIQQYFSKRSCKS